MIVHQPSTSKLPNVQPSSTRKLPIVQLSSTCKLPAVQTQPTTFQLKKRNRLQLTSKWLTVQFPST